MGEDEHPIYFCTTFVAEFEWRFRHLSSTHSTLHQRHHARPPYTHRRGARSSLGHNTLSPLTETLYTNPPTWGRGSYTTMGATHLKILDAPYSGHRSYPTRGLVWLSLNSSTTKSTT